MTLGIFVISFDGLLGSTDVAPSAKPLAAPRSLSGRATSPYGTLARVMPGAAGAAAFSMDSMGGSGMDSRG